MGDNKNGPVELAVIEKPIGHFAAYIDKFTSIECQNMFILYEFKPKSTEPYFWPESR